MNKKTFVLLIAFASLLTFGLLAVPDNSVQAQVGGPGCTDATGATVECTPTPEPGGGSGSGGDSGSGGGSSSGGSQNPTNTPLPITNPTEGTSTGGASWSGTCKGEIPDVTRCIALFHNGCNHVGGSVSSNINKDGSVDLTCTVPLILEPTPLPLASAPTLAPPRDEHYLGSCSNADGNVFDCFDQYKCENGLLVIEVDLYATGGTKYDFYCIPDEDIPQLDFPLRMPNPVGEDNNWTGGCNAGAGLDACLDLMSDACSEEGGEISIWYDDDGAGVYCENQSEAVLPASTPAPPIADAPSGGGGRPGWIPWISGGLIGLLIGLLLPAVQKLRNSAAGSSQTREHILLNKDDGGGGGAGKASQQDFKAAPNQPQEAAFDPFLKIDGIKGESNAQKGGAGVGKASQQDLNAAPNEPQEAAFDPFLKLDDIKGESNAQKGGQKPQNK